LSDLIMLDFCLRPMTGLVMTTLHCLYQAEHDNDVHTRTPSSTTISGPFLSRLETCSILEIQRMIQHLNPATNTSEYFISR
jgi:hypothetical protein